MFSWEEEETKIILLGQMEKEMSFLDSLISLVSE